jgi:hypothetical protein
MADAERSAVFRVLKEHVAKRRAKRRASTDARARKRAEVDARRHEHEEGALPA